MHTKKACTMTFINHSLTYGQDGPKDSGVVNGGAVPLPVFELVLALRDARRSSPAHVHHVVCVEHAQFILAGGEPPDLLAQRS